MLYKRQIRIEGKHNDGPSGHTVTITDSDTGEPVEFIKCIDIHMEPTELIAARITYIEHDETDAPVMKEGKLVESQEVVRNPELSIGALEVLPPLEKLVYQAIQDALLCVHVNQDGMWTASGRAVGIADRLIRDIKQLEVS